MGRAVRVRGLLRHAGARGARGALRAGAGDAARGEEGVRAAAQTLGGRAQFRLDGEVQKAESGLRAAAAGARGPAFRGLRDAHGAQGRRVSGFGELGY